MISQTEEQKFRTLKTSILNYITIHHGLKYIEVFIRATEDDISSDDIQRALHELVQENRIQRVEYMVEGSSSIFTFYLPFGSKIL